MRRLNTKPRASTAHWPASVDALAEWMHGFRDEHNRYPKTQSTLEHEGITPRRLYIWMGYHNKRDFWRQARQVVGIDVRPKLKSFADMVEWLRRFDEDCKRPLICVDTEPFEGITPENLYHRLWRNENFRVSWFRELQEI